MEADDDLRLQCECHGHYWGSGTSVTYLSGNKGSAHCCGDDSQEKWVTGSGICCDGVWKSGSGYECCTNADCPSDRPYCVNNKCVECRNNDDCADVDCSQQGYPNRIAECRDNICQCGPCELDPQCKDGYCCLKSEGQCKPAGYITSDKKYLCDPPDGFVNSVKESTSSTLFDYLLNLLHRFLYTP